MHTHSYAGLGYARNAPWGGSHLTRGYDEAGSQLCQQRTATSIEAKEAGLECHPSGREGTGAGISLRA
jgi:hypothetical protein